MSEEPAIEPTPAAAREPDVVSGPEKTEVRVFAPASVGNVTCGFDVMGFALQEPGDEVVARPSDGEGARVARVTGDDGLLPLNVRENTAGVAAQALLDHLDLGTGVELEVHKKMPLGSGMGSSAASAVAAAVAVNRLLGQPLERKELLVFAAEGERAACGAAHLDNVAPSLLGGFVFIRSQDPPDVIELECPVDLYASVVRPKIEIRTEDTRKILRREVPLGKAVVQWGNVGGLVAGLLKGDLELVARSLEDVIVEPVRSVLIPGFDRVKQAALEAGALGGGISGGGPSIFALSSSESTATEVARGMSHEFDAVGLDNEIYVSRIEGDGARVLEERD